MRLTKANGRYELESSYEERNAPKHARFRWDPKAKKWWTDDVKKAAAFAEVADEDIRAELNDLSRVREDNLAASRATNANASVDIPAPEGETYLPFQLGGIAYAMSRTAHAGLAGRGGAGHVPAPRNTDEIRTQAFQSEQPIARQARPQEGIHAGQHVGGQLESQRDKARRDAGGVREAYRKLEGQVAVRLYGDTPMEERQAAVDLFQDDLGCQIFVGSITAAGVGITLTASAHVVFAELDWVPGNISQAEDRAHRIGQTDSVLVQHLVFDGSMDATIAKTVVRKQRVIDRALDDKVEQPQLVKTEDKPKATISQPKARPAPNSDNIAEEQVEAIHEGLRSIAGMCDGARKLDGVGFSGSDTDFGHSLAGSPRLSQKQAKYGKKLVRKYRRQLADDILERAGVAS